jgi:hypothetical protein
VASPLPKACVGLKIGTEEVLYGHKRGAWGDKPRGEGVGRVKKWPSRRGFLTPQMYVE